MVSSFFYVYEAGGARVCVHFDKVVRSTSGPDVLFEAKLVLSVFYRELGSVPQT